MIYRIRGTLKKIVRRGTFLHTMAEASQRYLWQHAPRVFDWRPNKSTIDIDITTRCNLRCWNCDRAVGRAPSDESMSLEQLSKFVKESVDTRWRWRKIQLMGGEPTMHPQLGHILEILAPYKKMHPECMVTVVSNGYGEHVRGVLSSLPEWVTVDNSGKTSNQNSFQSYNVAPIDIDRLRDADFSRGCFVIEYCGLALTRNGYYCCGAGAAVDRVFGFDIGLKSLPSVTDRTLKNQLTRLCRYCGHYKYNYNEEEVSTEEISPSWRGAFERYRKERPSLTPY